MGLIWPDKLPRISSDGADVADDTTSSSSSAAIVGWALDDDDVIVVVGAVISTTSDSSPQQLKKDVISAIGKCAVTTTSDLSVIATFHENSNCPNGAYTSINKQNFQKHNDIFIYNPKEAEVWNTQYNQFQKRQSNNNNNNVFGTLQNSLLYVSKSNARFQELASVLNNGSRNKSEKQGNLILQQQQKLNTIPTKQHNTSYSLLLLHWNSVTDDNPLYQIPVLRALNSIWKERRCSISSVTLMIDFVFGLLIGLYVLQYPAKIIQRITRTQRT